MFLPATKPAGACNRKKSMKIQSLSIVVPNKACINHCASCPSRMHDDNYPILLDENRPDFDLHLREYMKRLEYARDNGCNVLMLTGTSEPQQNRKFLTWFGMMMQMMDKPFRNIEMQCTGIMLDEGYIQFLRRHVGVTTLALSMFSLDKDINRYIISPPKNLDLHPLRTAGMAKDAGMSVRICLNLTKGFDQFAKEPEKLFDIMKNLYHADQVTLRVLYAGDDDRPENVWVRENAADRETTARLYEFVCQNGTLLGRLPYGAYKYGLDGMSVVVDSDSMGKETSDVESYKYLILRPDCRLYSSWDDPASRVF